MFRFREVLEDRVPATEEAFHVGGEDRMVHAEADDAAGGLEFEMV